MTLKEARNPQTTLSRLSELLDACDQPRRAFADSILAIGTIEPRSGKELRAALAALEMALARNQRRDLCTAVAANPNLDREQWVRALEVAPEAALSNPILAFLLVERNPIIVSSHEVVALGRLAKHAISTPAGSASRQALADIISAGLPREPESFGSNFGQMGYNDLPAVPANRYCWQGDGRWHMRAIAIHEAGRAVMDVLLQGGVARSQEAITECERFGSDLVCHTKRWKDYINTIPFAPASHRAFSHTLFAECRDDYAHAEQNVVGWRGPDGTVWRHEWRPGFMAGRSIAPGEAVPAALGCFANHSWAWMSSDADTSGETDDLAVLADADGKIVWISEGIGAVCGCAELSGCSFAKRFPKAEIERLAELFGADSDTVRFAKKPKRALCPECEKPSLAMFVSGECDHCGYERDPDDD